jgi:hypothetical protein
MADWVKEENIYSQDGKPDTTREIEENPQPGQTKIPGDIASDLGTRKAQAFKTEDGEVILSGNGSISSTCAVR